MEPELDGTEDAEMAARLHALEHYPPESLGRAYYDFYQRYGLTFPGEPGGGDVIFVAHDFTHVLAGYEPDGPGELALQAMLVSASDSDQHFSSFCVSLSLQPLVDLAVVLTRQLVDELNAARALVVRQPVTTEADELVGKVAARLDARAQLDHCEHLFAPLRVRDADDGGVGQGGMVEQHRVDLGRVDVHAARDDEVGAAVG